MWQTKYLKIWDWELIFGCAVKVISSQDVCSPWYIEFRAAKTAFFPGFLKEGHGGNSAVAAGYGGLEILVIFFHFKDTYAKYCILSSLVSKTELKI